MRLLHHSGIYTLEVEQHLPISATEAWDFFSNPENLKLITPEHMGFNITSPKQTHMYEGQIISYVIGILPFVKSNWVTEITTVIEQHFFIDEQRFGPYRMWHHEHSFEENNDGTLMKDKITFKLPFGFLGDLAYKIFIRQQLREIFSYRIKTLEKIFGMSVPA